MADNQKPTPMCDCDGELGVFKPVQTNKDGSCVLCAHYAPYMRRSEGAIPGAIDEGLASTRALKVRLLRPVTRDVLAVYGSARLAAKALNVSPYRLLRAARSGEVINGCYVALSSDEGAA